MASYAIPFNKPGLVGKELSYIGEAVAKGHSAGDGVFSRRCQALLERELGVAKALLTTSCTHALEMAALLLRIAPGDEAIVPSFTFVSTANAFALRGARPVFADIQADTLTLDPRGLEALITPRTRAIVVVHYAGVGCDMAAIQEIASRHAIPVVEDNAHGLFGRYRGRPLGTFGCLATLSFHETKNFACGEGGALLINDPSFIERAEILREKGTDRSRFFRGETDKYTWVDLGSSYVPSDLLAAWLYAQFEARQEIQNRRRWIWHRYRDGLKEWAAAEGVRLPFVPQECEQSWHMFYLVMPSLEVRQRFIAHLKSRGILAVFHYVPLHLSNMGAQFGGRPGQCSVTERVAERLVRLPFYNTLTAAEQDTVIGAALAFRASGAVHGWRMASGDGSRIRE